MTAQGPASTPAEQLAGQLIRHFEWHIIFGVSALVVMIMMVLSQRRLRRTHDERTTAGRRGSYHQVVTSGNVAEAAAVVNQALRSRRKLEDLAVALAQPLSGERVAVMCDAARSCDAADRLCRRMSSRRTMTRARAALLCGRLHLSGCEAQLGRLLSDADGDVQRAAGDALSRVHSQASHHELINALHHADRAGGLQSERYAEWLSAPGSAPALAAAITDPAHAAARPWLLEALGLTGTTRYAPLVARIVAGEHFPVEDRVKACRALGRLRRNPEELADALAYSHSWAVRAQAARALNGQLIASAVHVLRDSLSDESWWVRANSAVTLRSYGEPGVQALRDALSDPDRYARERAAEALALHEANQFANFTP